MDKDLASGLLAHHLHADMLLIPTAVSRVAIRFGKPDQRWLDTITVDEARGYLQAGEFGAGSMEPKVAAVADFVASTPGAVGVIGAAEEIGAILEGKSGTRIVATVSTTLLVAVNGTLMRGFKLNPSMLEAGAAFVRETTTEPAYRLWTINDDYPAMIRVNDESAPITLEIWSVPLGRLARIFEGAARTDPRQSASSGRIDGSRTPRRASRCRRTSRNHPVWRLARLRCL